MENRKKRRRRLRWDRILLVAVLWAAAVFGIYKLLAHRFGVKPDASSTLSAPPASVQSVPEEKPSASGTQSTSDSAPAVEPEQPKTDLTQWNLILANPTHSLPEGFSVDTAALSDGHEVDARIVQDAEDMLDAAAADGMNLLVCSAYRSVDYQTRLFNEKKQEFLNAGYGDNEAGQQAAAIVAVPGTSEHNTGLALDIVSVYHQVLDDAYAETDEAQWLKAHAAEYGFILRYPQGKEDMTGIIFEPWHYRYVGKEYAQEIMDSGLCFEEWLAAQGK